MTTFERVGFIGLGGMGRGLVKNLVAKGVAVTAYDLNPAAVEIARSFGATAASNLEPIRDCRIVMICVNEAEDVEALLIRKAMALNEQGMKAPHARRAATPKPRRS